MYQTTDQYLSPNIIFQNFWKGNAIKFIKAFT